MRAELVNLNHCAVPFLSRAAANLCWYYYSIYYKVYSIQYTLYSTLDVCTLDPIQIQEHVLHILLCPRYYNPGDVVYYKFSIFISFIKVILHILILYSYFVNKELENGYGLVEVFIITRIDIYQKPIGLPAYQ